MSEKNAENPTQVGEILDKELAEEVPIAEVDYTEEEEEEDEDEDDEDPDDDDEDEDD